MFSSGRTRDFMRTAVRRVITTDEGKQMLTGYLEKILAQGIAVGEAKGKAEGKAEGIAEGKQIGSDERAVSIARGMLKDGFSTETILKLTRLEPKTLMELKLSL